MHCIYIHTLCAASYCEEIGIPAFATEYSGINQKLKSKDYGYKLRYLPVVVDDGDCGDGSDVLVCVCVHWRVYLPSLCVSIRLGRLLFSTVSSLFLCCCRCRRRRRICCATKTIVVVARTGFYTRLLCILDAATRHNNDTRPTKNMLCSEVK